TEPPNGHFEPPERNDFFHWLAVNHQAGRLNHQRNLKGGSAKPRAGATLRGTEPLNHLNHQLFCLYTKKSGEGVPQ
ncbi:hypothetical protein ACMWHX_21530, partial [Klebsiella pneumoniae]